MTCDWHGGAAAERDVVSRRVDIAYRLQCHNHPVVDTGAEFASPSGAPLGYDSGSPVGEVLPGPLEPRAPVERIAQSCERVAMHSACMSIPQHMSARAQSLVCPCAAYAWSSAVIPGVAEAYA